jgi:DNA-binding NarL/FixJ family response regulator
VAIVDDHAIVALAIGPLIASHPALEYRGHAASVPELFENGVRADLVVLDLLLRDGSDPGENVRRLRRSGAGVLVLTSGDNRFLLRNVLRAETLGVVRKSARPEEILAAIALAASGEPVLSMEWAMIVDTDAEFRSAPLTEREREVLALYASGVGAKSVAQQLHISENTVNDHVKRIRWLYQRLGRPANTKVELYQRGQEDGFLPVPSDS